MNEKEFWQLLLDYEKQWEKNPSNGSRLICAISRKIAYILDMIELKWPEDNDLLKNKEQSLIQDPDCPCPYSDQNEKYVISYQVKNYYDIFHDGFWAYMAKEDEIFATYCTYSSKSTPNGKKLNTYVQPKRALHYLLAHGTPVTKNKIKRYFKLICQNNAPQKFAVPA